MHAGQTASDILFVNFNQDFSCVSVGTRHGYKIYNCDPFGKCYGKTDGGIGIVEMLFSTSLVALVGAGEQPAFSPRRLQLTNTKRQSTICELTFVTAILAVKLNRRRLVVVLEEHIYIYDISNMKLLHTIDTNPNPNALCSLSPSSDPCYLAYPSHSSGSSTALSSPSSSSSSHSSSTGGELLIFDAASLQAVNIIQAHKAPLSAVCFNSDGKMVATASDKGTVIRVFAVPSGQKLHQFRRGAYPARIFSLAFNVQSTYLAVSSDSDTVHIFKMTPGSPGQQSNGAVGVGGSANGARDRDDPNNLAKSCWVSSDDTHCASINPVSMANNRLSDITRRGLTAAAGAAQRVLPESFTEMLEPQRDFAFAKLPAGTKGVPNICALASSNPQLIVVSAEGIFHSFGIPLETGGECPLLKTFSLTDTEEDMVPGPMG
ncbi:WD40 repeat-like protein [Gonapodya prolifera JEL478]|uniref:Autophagy-related protein 18 n=1 Tax=Gonapodya prolifera (strain JEL478) TaxID=1344416 RepID=A0A139A4L9_GONPJ|nr:WD40 repeat-like protein [Gonapodya prolifera JEL478]|eukprot:KXS11752.1 WD40 repeat-like protein [Gonapodya prolifera JEL478]